MIHWPVPFLQTYQKIQENLSENVSLIVMLPMSKGLNVKLIGFAMLYSWGKTVAQ